MMYHDFNQVVEGLRTNEDMLNDNIGVQIANSPKESFLLKYSASLDHHKLPVSAPLIEHKNERMNMTATKVVTFTKHDTTKFTFNKDQINKSVAGRSSLSLLLDEKPSKVERPGLPRHISASRLAANVPALHLVIFVMLNSSHFPTKINVRTVPNATVEQVIELSVRQLNAQIENVKVDEVSPNSGINPKACQLMLAEDDGTPDTDTPVLQRDAEIHRFGCTTFSLCRDPDYAKDMKVFKVILPSKEYQMVLYNRALTLREVLEKVCRKRLLDPLVHYFVSVRDPQGPECDLDTPICDLDTNEIIMRSKTVQNSPSSSNRRKSIMLLLPPVGRHSSGTHKRTPSNTNPQTLPEISQDPLGAPQMINSALGKLTGHHSFNFYFTLAAVRHFVQYRVTKINKYGKRQERIMGIDSERITNTLPPNAKAKKTNRIGAMKHIDKYFGENKIAKPIRMISEVSKACIVDRPVQHYTNKKPFFIEFKDGKRAEYEADKEKADEIVARINFILREVSTMKTEAS